VRYFVAILAFLLINEVGAGTLTDPLRTALRARVEQLQSGQEVRVMGESIASHKLIPEFYERRGFQAAWTNSLQLRQLAQVIDESASHGLEPTDYHQKAVHELLSSSNGDTAALADRELLLTDAVIRLAYHLHYGKANPRDIYRGWTFSRSLGSIVPVQALESLFQDADIKGSIERYAPQIPLYGRLRQTLAQYRSIEASGGWPTIPAGAVLKRSMRDGRINALRARLIVSQDLAAKPLADAELFDETVESGVKKFQARHGLEEDGIVGTRTLEALNVSVSHRIEQLQVNLERLRWVAQDIVGDYVLVDIAGYRAYLALGGRIVWSSKVVVGRPYRNTPAFRATIDSIVLNPTWTVPPTILREDVLPQLGKTRAYLVQHDMQVIDSSGQPIDPDTIDWPAFSTQPFPYQIVQAPSPENPLGQLKFIMPNSYSVYLHDTPAKDLFLKTVRAFSSGCIRLEKAHELATLLLDDEEKWGDPELKDAVATGETRTVHLKRRVPVMLLYFTAYVAGDGTVHFRPDLYTADMGVLAALRAPFRFSPVDPSSH
jgi:murein L,D-transpeptidase YcbB/YkuD